VCGNGGARCCLQTAALKPSCLCCLRSAALEPSWVHYSRHAEMCQLRTAKVGPDYKMKVWGKSQDKKRMIICLSCQKVQHWNLASGVLILCTAEWGSLTSLFPQMLIWNWLENHSNRRVQYFPNLTMTCCHLLEIWLCGAVRCGAVRCGSSSRSSGSGNSSSSEVVAAK